ncbi:metal ABC transporter solute-binding protein, Zn/Mn family [Petrocella sp. FN5]|uniref:metal ABC transporter solute-binding protein, Zn/Mn family n=1 Tax=Petrocella sp. FN5 TaxID=3032002 RepID=UPI0023DAB675|nr:zinc ABC transporter substrate-binding protein [Petrocella sp. FN5]MDF1616766.1 zinc ABC transporter substrate-binding protein [Petrocella sp. FN5]
MKIIKLLILLSLFTLLIAGCGPKETESDIKNETNEPAEVREEVAVVLEPIKVSVPIGPIGDFVEQVGGDLVSVNVLLPPGSSESNYQPSPKEMNALAESQVYFSIGMGSEVANILPNMTALNENLKVVHLDEVVDLVYPAMYFEDYEDNHIHEENHDHDHDHEDEHEDEEDHEHSHEGRDPHMWMSPKRVVVMIEAIRDELIALDSDSIQIFEENAKAYIQELTALDEQILGFMTTVSNKKFIIMHPSLGYFADDYDLEMVAIEEDGKATTARRLGEIIEFAKANDIKVVLYQKEFDNQQAKTLADEIGGSTMVFEPLSKDYLGSLKSLIDVFEAVLK